jgi:hypothetical protein
MNWLPRDLPARLGLLCFVGLASLAIYVGVREGAHPLGILLSVMFPAVVMVPIVVYGRWLTRKLEEHGEEETLD